MSVFNLYGAKDKQRIGYFPYSYGIDREGNECMMVINHDPHASGCNPMYWDASPHTYYGHEFATYDDAYYFATNARNSWSMKSVDKTQIAIVAMKFHEVITVEEI